MAYILSMALYRSMKKTRIMSGANLSYVTLMKYLHRLVGCGLVVYVEDRRVYELTDSGRMFLDEYVELKNLETGVLQYSGLFEKKRSGLVEMLNVR